GRTQLDRSRRLSAAITEAIGWRRSLLAAPENRRAVQLQGLVQSLGELLADASRDRDVRPQLAVAAELAVRIDAQSTRLRDVAARLQRLADRWPALASDARVADLEAVTGVAVEETRAAVADAPIRLGELPVDRGR